jgi:hypothetical protein
VPGSRLRSKEGTLSQRPRFLGPLGGFGWSHLHIQGHCLFGAAASSHRPRARKSWFIAQGSHWYPPAPRDRGGEISEKTNS